MEEVLQKNLLEVLFGGSLEALSRDTSQKVFAQRNSTIYRPLVYVIDVWQSGLTCSNREARQMKWLHNEKFEYTRKDSAGKGYRKGSEEIYWTGSEERKWWKDNRKTFEWKGSSGKREPESTGKSEQKDVNRQREVFCESHKQTVEIIGESKIYIPN